MHDPPTIVPVYHPELLPMRSRSRFVVPLGPIQKACRRPGNINVKPCTQPFAGRPFVTLASRADMPVLMPIRSPHQLNARLLLNDAPLCALFS